MKKIVTAGWWNAVKNVRRGVRDLSDAARVGWDIGQQTAKFNPGQLRREKLKQTRLDQSPKARTEYYGRDSGILPYAEIEELIEQMNYHPNINQDQVRRILQLQGGKQMLQSLGVIPPDAAIQQNTTQTPAAQPNQNQQQAQTP